MYLGPGPDCLRLTFRTGFGTILVSLLGAIFNSKWGPKLNLFFDGLLEALSGLVLGGFCAFLGR